MIEWVLDVMGFLLLCVGAKLAMPPLLRLLCRIAAVYLAVFSICYYIWLIPQFRNFKNHQQLFHTGMSVAFAFEGFWKLLSNMILLQGILPVAVVFLLYFGVRWLSASTGPGSGY